MNPKEFMDYMKGLQNPRPVDTFAQSLLGQVFKGMEGNDEQAKKLELEKNRAQISSSGGLQANDIPEEQARAIAKGYGVKDTDMDNPLVMNLWRNAIAKQRAQTMIGGIPTQGGYVDATGAFNPTNTLSQKVKVLTSPATVQAETKNIVEEQTRPQQVETAKQMADVDIQKGAVVAIKDKQASLNDAMTVFDELSGKLSSLAIEPGALNRVLQGGQQKIESFLQTDPKATAYESAKTGMASAIARMYEKGVLTDQDRKYATVNIPDLFDSQEVREEKQQTLRNIFSRTKANLAKSMSELPKISTESKYSIGQVLNVNGKQYRVIGLSDPLDPDLEEVK